MNEEQMIIEKIQRYPYFIKETDEAFQLAHPEMIKEIIIKTRGEIFPYISEAVIIENLATIIELLEDKKIEKGPNLLEQSVFSDYFRELEQKSPEVVEKVLPKNRQYILLASDEFINSHPEATLQALATHPHIISKINPAFINAHSQDIFAIIKDKMKYYRNIEFPSFEAIDFWQQNEEKILELIDKKIELISNVPLDFLTEHSERILSILSKDPNEVEIVPKEFFKEFEQDMIRIIMEKPSLRYSHFLLENLHLYEEEEDNEAYYSTRDRILEYVEEKYPEIIINTVEKDADFFEDVSLVFCEEHPEVYVAYAEALMTRFDTSEENNIKNAVPNAPIELVIRAVRRNPHVFDYTTKEQREAHPELFIAQSIHKVSSLQSLTPEQQLKYAKEIIETIEYTHGYTNHLSGVLKNVSEEFKEAHLDEIIQLVEKYPPLVNQFDDSFKRAHPELLIKLLGNIVENGTYDAVKKEVSLISDEALEEHSEMVLDATKECPQIVGYLSDSFLKNHTEMYLPSIIAYKQGIDFAIWNLSQVTSEAQMKYPELVLEAVKKDYSSLQYISDEFKDKYPEVFLYACVGASSFGTSFPLWQQVSEEIKLAHPDVMEEAIQKNPELVKLLSKEFQMNHPEILIRLIENRELPVAMSSFDEEVLKTYPEIFKTALINRGYHCLKGLSESVQLTHSQIIADYITNPPDIYLSNYGSELMICKQFWVEYPQLLIETNIPVEMAVAMITEEFASKHFDIVKQVIIEATKARIPTRFSLDKSVLNSHPELQIIMAWNEDSEGIENTVNDETQLAYPDLVIEAALHNKKIIHQVCDEFKEKYPEIYLANSIHYEGHQEASFELYRLKGLLANDEFLDKHVDIIIEVASKNPTILKYLSDDFKLKHPEIFLELYYREKDSHMMRTQSKEPLFYTNEEFQMTYPELVMNYTNNNWELWKLVSPKFQQEHIEEVKRQLFLRDGLFPQLCEELRNNPEIIEIATRYSSHNLMYAGTKYLFGEELESRAKKAIHDSALSFFANYSEPHTNLMIRHMINLIGIDETEKLLKLPQIEEEEIKQKTLEQNLLFQEIYDVKYKPRIELSFTLEFFRLLNLSSYKINNRDISFEFYKKLNQELEKNFDSSVINSKEQQIDILRQCLISSGLDKSSVNEGALQNISNAISTSYAKYINEKLALRKGLLTQEIQSGLNEQEQNQAKVIVEIVELTLARHLKENWGCVNKNALQQELHELLNEKKENGDSRYSPHIQEKEEWIIETIMRHKQSLGELSPVTVLQKTKNGIGDKWIRKITNLNKELEEGNIPANSLEELKKTGDSMFIDEQTDGYATLKEDVDQKKVKEFFRMCVIDGVLSYEQLERVFGSVHEPYPEGMIQYFAHYHNEIHSNPDVWYRFAEICNEFDKITQSSELRNRFENGRLTPREILAVIDSKKHFGHDELGMLAGKVGLSETYVKEARNLFEITRKRKYSQIPQFKATDREDEGYTIRGRMLRADEVMNIFAGNVTDCCQVFGNVGEGSMKHDASSKKGGVFIVEKVDQEGKVVDYLGQSWVWRNGSTLCFDNIELPKTNDEADETRLTQHQCQMVYEIYKEAAQRAIDMDRQMLQRLLADGKITEAQYQHFALEQVTTGMGYNNLMRMFGAGDKEGKVVSVPEDYVMGSGWVDSKSEVRVLAESKKEKTSSLEETEGFSLSDIEDTIRFPNRRTRVEYRAEGIPKDRIIEFLEASKITLEVEDNDEFGENQLDSDSSYREDDDLFNTTWDSEEDEWGDEECEDEDNGYKESFSKYTIALAEHYKIEPIDMHFLSNEDKDWYAITAETDTKLEILEIEMVEQKDDLPKLEMELSIYQKMMKANEKDRAIILDGEKEETIKLLEKMKDEGLLLNVIKQEDTGKVAIKIDPDKMKEYIETNEEKYQSIVEERLVTPYQDLAEEKE